MASKHTADRAIKAGFATKAIHAGQVPDPTTGAVMQPIYQVSTYRQPGLGEGWKFDYARTINPTRAALERNLAALEGGAAAHVCAGGGGGAPLLRLGVVGDRRGHDPAPLGSPRGGLAERLRGDLPPV